MRVAGVPIPAGIDEIIIGIGAIGIPASFSPFAGKPVRNHGGMVQEEHRPQGRYTA